MLFLQVYGEVKYLCDDERKKRADEDGVSENEVDQEDCPKGYADLEAKEGAYLLISLIMKNAHATELF